MSLPLQQGKTKKFLKALVSATVNMHPREKKNRSFQVLREISSSII